MLPARAATATRTLRFPVFPPTSCHSVRIPETPSEVTETQEGTAFRLLIQGDGSVRSVPLAGDRWTIGRSLDCSISVPDPSVSRRHLLLERTADGFLFRDLGGANPVLMDGRPTRRGALRPGQRLTIGLTHLTIEERAVPNPVAPHHDHTVVLSREVIDEEIPIDHKRHNAATAARVLESIEWTFADLGDLSHAAEPLLNLALNLTRHRTGWLARFPTSLGIETLAVITPEKPSEFTPTLPETVLAEARRIASPHILTTHEHGADHCRLLIPLGKHGDGLLVLEDAEDDAPVGQELLRLARSLGHVVWHRLQETMERIRLRDELERLRFHGTDAHNALLASTRLQTAREAVRSRANSPQPVLLVGEAGTEIEPLSRYLHAESTRRDRPFLTWNASRHEPQHRHDELFGDGELRGMLQRAAGGTLLLEEVHRLQPALQEQLAAYALEDEKNPPKLVLATTPGQLNSSSALQQVIDGGPVTVPPLRDDARDVLALAELFLSELGPAPDGTPRLISERTKRVLTSYEWPGNVRELRLTIEAAAANAGNQPIAPRHLPDELTSKAERSTPQMPTLEDVERRHIQDVMRHANGVRTRAAQILGIANSTLYEKLKKYRIE